MKKNLKKITVAFIFNMCFLMTYAQENLYVGMGSNMYLGTGSIVSELGNVVLEENITGATTGRLILTGNTNTTLDMNNASVHGLDIQKSLGNTVTLLDSFSANNLYLSSGKLLLGVYTGRVNTNMDNNALLQMMVMM